MPQLSLEETSIINNHPFAQIMSSQSNDSGFAELSYCPLQLLDNNQFIGHLARNNSLLSSLNTDEKKLVKVIFTGPQGYISPRWHSEQMVPTWNYATVALICSLHVIESVGDKLKAMEKISYHFDPKWDFNEFNHEKNIRMVQQMLSAITVFKLELLEVKSKFKLSQNRSIACRCAFQENLMQAGGNELAAIQLQE